ncbi:MAG: prepilin-type N-terminal cleavage/methylation domain-containing protein [bacterium]|nr:prepilin-type N-terminal cleavage/methylation domain-containing protein [bacterium]
MRERLSKEEGFTLIELMVVVLIIAVLVAIAIPSFLGFRNRAQDRSAQADLRNTLLAEKAVWVDTGAYTEVEATLKAFEPTLITNTSGAADAGVFTDVPAVSDDAVCLAQISQSGSFFAIFDDASATGGSFYGAGSAAITCPTALGQPADTATVVWSPTGFPAVP